LGCSTTRIGQIEARALAKFKAECARRGLRLEDLLPDPPGRSGASRRGGSGSG
jgi:hypothetical protein